MIRIVELDDAMIPEAKALVARVFPSQDFTERISFWVYKHHDNPIIKALLKLSGSMTVYRYWAALNENGDICGYTPPMTPMKPPRSFFMRNTGLNW